MNLDNIVSKRFGDGVVTRVDKIDSHGVVYRIEFDISYGEGSLIKNAMVIPERWNSRFVGIGNGGIAGTLGTAWYAFSEEGYAAAQSDLGTSALRRGEVKLAEPCLWKDYGYRAIHGMTVTAKAILKEVFGRAPEYSYFYGASAGGNSALSEAQRYPEDYDGIVAGVPSNNALALVTYFLWCYLKLGGDVGHPIIGKELSGEINRCAVEFFKTRGDGEPEDDFITYPYAGESTVSDFLKYLEEKLPSISREQLKALEDVYRGPRNPRTGEQIFCGMPIGAEINTGYFLGDGITETFDLPWYKIFFGEDFDEKKFDFDSDYEKIHDGVGRYFAANDADLSPFERNGGRLIIFSGAADPYGPYADHLNYYRRASEAMGGIGRVGEFFKLFILPGKGHSSDGKGVNAFKTSDPARDMIAVIRAWREDGVVPSTLETSHKYGDETGGYKFKRLVPAVTKIGKEGVDYPVCTSKKLLESK